MDACERDSVDSLSEITNEEDKGNPDDMLDVGLMVDDMAGDDRSNNDEENDDDELALGVVKLDNDENLSLDVVVPGTKVGLL